MNPRVKQVIYKQPYTLHITFANGEVRAFNLEGYLHYPVYAKLKNTSFCSSAKVFMGTVIWDDETDLFYT
jgi:hypothetical protein